VTIPIANWSENILKKLHIPNIMAQDVPNLPPDYYTCQFRSNKLERYQSILIQKGTKYYSLVFF